MSLDDGLEFILVVGSLASSSLIAKTNVSISENLIEGLHKELKAIVRQRTAQRQRYTYLEIVEIGDAGAASN